MSPGPWQVAGGSTHLFLSDCSFINYQNFWKWKIPSLLSKCLVHFLSVAWHPFLHTSSLCRALIQRVGHYIWNLIANLLSIIFLKDSETSGVMLGRCEQTGVAVNLCVEIWSGELFSRFICLEQRTNCVLFVILKEPACQYRRHKRCGFESWVGKISWRRKWQTTPVLLPGKSHGQRSPVGYSPWGRRVGHNWSDLALSTST